MGIISRRSELDQIRDILTRCDAQTSSLQEDLEELHLIEQFRKRKDVKEHNAHNSARHLIMVERIEVANASIIALAKTKTEYMKKLRTLVGDMKKVIRAHHAEDAAAACAVAARQQNETASSLPE